MLIRFVLLFLLSLSLTANENNDTVVNADGMTLHLQGIGVAQELQSDLYIGAVYYPKSFTSIPEISNDSISKRLTFKILPNFMTAKALQRHWKERIALNNPRNVWMAKSESILRLADAFKDNLKNGDKVDFDYSPNGGTRVYLNNQLIETIEGRQFFVLLMSAWFGDIPPTKSFKSALLAQNEKSERELVLNQFNALSFNARTLVSGSKPTPIADSVASVTTPVKVNATNKPGVAMQASTKPLSAPSSPTTKETTPHNLSKIGDATTATPPSAVAIVGAESTPASPVAVVEDTPLASQMVVATENVAAPATNPALDEDLLMGAYKREAMERIRGFLEYPPRAWRLGLTGSGVLRVTLDKSGSLVSSDVMVSTNQMILDQAMLKMLERSLPLPPPPKELSSSQLSFEIAVEFVR